MKKVPLSVLLLFYLIAATLAFLPWKGSEAGEPSSPELLALGRELFNTKEKLGVKFACILCHKQEKAIKKSSVEKLGDKLPEVINLHILQKAKGTKALDPASKEMQALVAYITHEHSV